jgi:hypothetical protein
MSRESLVARVLAFQDGSLQGRPPESFDALARDLHAWQAAHDPVIASLVEGPVTTWAQIPAVPVDVFKQLRVGTVKDDKGVLFRTSGTTQGVRGVHRMRATEAYDHGALLWARRFLPDMPARIVALLDDPRRATDSSLSHMVGLFSQDASWHVTDGRVDTDAANAAVRASDAPVFLCATAFALAIWLEGEVPRLPDGSLVMVTGGFKGRVVRLSDDDLYADARTRLAPKRIVTEYGMTELSSQMWGSPEDAYRPPPWLKALAVDPESGAPLEPGTPGQLRFFDLANIDGSVAIETLDEGVVLGDGAVRLRGRLAGAPARGCSLTVEDGWVGEDTP